MGKRKIRQQKAVKSSSLGRCFMSPVPQPKIILTGQDGLLPKIFHLYYLNKISWTYGSSIAVRCVIILCFLKDYLS
jgi:hypothetical protein